MGTEDTEDTEYTGKVEDADNEEDTTPRFRSIRWNRTFFWSSDNTATGHIPAYKYLCTYICTIYKCTYVRL
jgi:hypothetical protein